MKSHKHLSYVPSLLTLCALILLTANSTQGKTGPITDPKKILAELKAIQDTPSPPLANPYKTEGPVQTKDNSSDLAINYDPQAIALLEDPKAVEIHRWIVLPPDKLWPQAGLMRRGLETQRARNTITKYEYDVKGRLVAKYEGLLVQYSYDALGSRLAFPPEEWQKHGYTKSSISYSYDARGNLTHILDQDRPRIELYGGNPNIINWDITDNGSMQWLQFFYERKALLDDLSRKIINRAEYEQRLKVILEEEREWARKNPLSDEEMTQYQVLIDRLPADIAELEKALAANKPLTETLAPWAAAFVALLGVTLPYQLNRRKDAREKRELEMKESKLQLEINELRSKNEKLEQEIGDARKKAEGASRLVILAS